MTFLIVALVFLTAANADVAHLKNAYLPPVISSLTENNSNFHAQESHEILQAAVQEVVDKSVVESVEVYTRKVKNIDGQVVTESPHFNSAISKHIETSEPLAQVFQNAANFAEEAKSHFQQKVAKAEKEHVAPVSETHDMSGQLKVESGHFGYIQAIDVSNEHVHHAAAIAHQVKSHVQQAVASFEEAVEPTAAVSVPQSVNGQIVGDVERFGGPIKGTSSVQVQQVQNDTALAYQVKAHVQQVVSGVETEEPAAHGSEIYQKSQQQTDYYSQITQQEKQKERQGAILHQQDEMNVDVAVPKQEQQQYRYSEKLVTIPAVPEYTQQQETGYYGKQSYAVGSTGAAGVDTQYADNGGYIY